jgi:hypothetical protein
MDTTHELFHLDEWRLVLTEVMYIPKSFIWIIILFEKAFTCGHGVNFEVMLAQTLNHYM